MECVKHENKSQSDWKIQQQSNWLQHIKKKTKNTVNYTNMIKSSERPKKKGLTSAREFKIDHCCCCFYEEDETMS